MIKIITDEIKNKLRDLNVPRYKYLVQVFIGSKQKHGANIGSRFLWDEDIDNYASATFANDEMFCVSIAFGVYQY